MNKYNHLTKDYKVTEIQRKGGNSKLAILQNNAEFSCRAIYINVTCN